CRVCHNIVPNGQGLLLPPFAGQVVLDFIMSSPELQPNKFTDDEVKHKSRIELHAIRCWAIGTTTAGKEAKIGGEYQQRLRKVSARFMDLYCLGYLQYYYEILYSIPSSDF
ncbi:MAG: hypothetical protein ABL927_13385, partial [Bdellovibrionales bacterium]